MEQIVVAFITELFKYGLPGVFIGYLIWKNWRLEKALETKDLLIKEVQEKRVSEAIQTVMTLGTNSAGLEKVGDAVNALSGHLSENTDVLKDVDKTLDRLGG